MSPSFVGSIYIFGGNFAIYGFALCQGQLLPIAENDVLFTLLGTTYGGDGVQTFGLPDLRGRLPIHMGTGAGLNPYVIGQSGGTENVSLSVSQIPSHTHLINANSASATLVIPTTSSYLGASNIAGAAEKFYNPGPSNAIMSNAMVSSTGSSIPISIVQPVLAMNYVISLYGIFPSQN